MKTNKLKKITIILLILLLTMVGVYGVYTKDKNSIKNKINEYKYAKDLDGARVINLELDTTTNTTIKDKDGNVVESATDEEIAEKGYTKEEIPVNKEEDITEENYALSKELIEKRLKKLDVKDYTVKFDNENGNIIVELPENNDTDNLIENLYPAGKLEIVDAQTQEVLLNNNDIKECVYGINTLESGYVAYFSIEFKDKAKLEEITKTYVPATQEAEESTKTEETESNSETGEAEIKENEQTEETQDNTETEADTVKAEDKKIIMKYDGQEVMNTSFSEPVTDGKMILTIGQETTDINSLNNNREYAKSIAAILSTPNLPLTYTLNGSQYIESTQKDTITNTIISCATLVILVSAIILIVKYKANGLFATAANIGFLGLLLLTIKTWNVVLSTEGFAAIIFVLLLNHVILNKILVNINKEKENKKPETTKAINSAIIEFTLKIIPLFIIAVIFVFQGNIATNSFGMITFWGLTLIELYNLIITKNLLK